MMITTLLAILSLNAPTAKAYSMHYGHPGQSRHHRPDAGDRPNVFTASETAPALDGPRAPKAKVDAEEWADAIAHDFPAPKDSAPMVANDTDCVAW